MRRPWLLFLHLPRRPTPQQTSPGSHVHSRQLPASDHAVSWPAALASVLSPLSARRDRYPSNPVTDGSQVAHNCSRRSACHSPDRRDRQRVFVPAFRPLVSCRGHISVPALALPREPRSQQRFRVVRRQGQQGKPLCVLRVVPPTSALSLAKSCSLTHGCHPGPALQEGSERAGRLLLKLGH